jgi:PAS domain S-box-containing protein
VRGLPESEVGRTIAPEGTLATAIETGRPVLKRRFSETEDPPPSANYAVFAEAMDAPILAGGETRGVLGVCSREHGSFDDDDLRLLDAFARLASIALRNAEAFEESTRRAQVQQGFFRIASVLGEPLSAAETLDAVAQAAAEALGGDAALLLRPVGERLEVAGSYELRPELQPLVSGGVDGEIFRHASAEHRILAAPNVEEDARFAEWHDALTAAGARSLLAVPVEEERGQRGGLVVVLFTQARTFTDDDLEIAKQVVTAARGALERSGVYEFERRARALAQHLASTGRTLTMALDPAVVLDEIPRQVTRLLDTHGASVRLLEGDELVLHGAVGPGSTGVLGARAPSTASLAGDIVQSREPATVVDTSADRRHADADPLLAAGQYRAYAGVPMIGPDGSVYGVVAAVSSRPREWLSEEVDALQALAGNAATALANAELYQRVALEKGQSEAILSNVADGIVAVDREGAVVLWNAAAERITGVPAAEAVGRSPDQALGRALSAEGPSPPGRLLAVRRGSEDVWLSVTEAVMIDPAGAVAGRIYAFRDISDERVVEQMKTEFVSTVSHELRTPLTSIYGFAETLLREDVQFGEEERRTFLSYIASESERLTTIVDTLLSVARLESGEVQLRLVPIDVGSVVTEAVRAVETTLSGNGHSFVAELPDEPLDAAADRDKLRQVLSILLDNAVRYSPAGGRVVVGARLVADSVEVRVRDEGVGIPATKQEHIFRKFYRGDAGTRNVGTGNTGLGLFIAEGLVNAMGGRIWVDSTEGRGSTFAFELPRAKSETGLAGVETPGSPA